MNLLAVDGPVAGPALPAYRALVEAGDLDVGRLRLLRRCVFPGRW